MMLRTYLFWAPLLVVVGVQCFQRLQQQTGKTSTAFVLPREQHQPQQMDASRRNILPPKIRDQLALQSRKRLEWDFPLRQTAECSCPPEYDGVYHSDHDGTEDVISDVGEAAFAMLGSLWAEDGSIIPTSIIFPDGANSNQNDMWSVRDQPADHKDLTMTRIRGVLESLANHPYADEVNLDSFSSQVLQ